MSDSKNKLTNDTVKIIMANLDDLAADDSLDTMLQAELDMQLIGQDPTKAVSDDEESQNDQEDQEEVQEEVQEKDQEEVQEEIQVKTQPENGLGDENVNVKVVHFKDSVKPQIRGKGIRQVMIDVRLCDLCEKRYAESEIQRILMPS